MIILNLAVHQAGILRRIWITTRKSHSYTNAHVANMAGKAGANLVIDNDAHSPSDFVGSEKAFKIMLGAGISDNEIKNIINNNKIIFEKAVGGKNG